MRKLPVESQRQLLMSVGTHRSERPLSPVEVANAFEVELQAGTSTRELAAFCHLRDTTMVGRFRSLTKLAPSIAHLVDWSSGPLTISFSTAVQVARVSEHGDQEYLVSSALTHGFTAGEMQQVLQIMARAQVNAQEAVARVLRLRPVIIKRYVYMGIVLNESVNVYLATLNQRERDALLQRALGARVPRHIEWNGKLGLGKFSLVGGEDFAAFLGELTDGFETLVNDALTLEVSPGDGASD